MSSTATYGGFSIGGALALTRRLVARAAWRLIGIVVLEFVATSLLTWIVGRILAPISPALVGVADFLIEQVALGLASAMVVAVSVGAAENRPCGFAEALAVGARRIVAISVVCLLQSVAIGIGFVFLVVPGVVIAVLLVAAVPVFMIEEVGPLDSFSRSAALTDGHRLQVCGLLVLVFFVAVLAIAGMLLPFFHATVLTFAVAALGGVTILALILVALVLPTAIYLTLRDVAPGASLGPPNPGAL